MFIGGKEKERLKKQDKTFGAEDSFLSKCLNKYFL